MPLARISLTLSRHFSLSFIASGRSSGLHPVSSHSCCMCVQAGLPAFDQPSVGIHRSTSLMGSSLLLQLCPVCLFHLTWIVFVMGGRWPYSWCFVGCSRQDLYIYIYIYIYILHLIWLSGIYKYCELHYIYNEFHNIYWWSVINISDRVNEFNLGESSHSVNGACRLSVSRPYVQMKSATIL